LREAWFHAGHAAGEQSAAAVDQDVTLEHNRNEQAIVLDATGEASKLAGRHQRDRGKGRVDGTPAEFWVGEKSVTMIALLRRQCISGL